MTSIPVSVALLLSICSPVDPAVIRAKKAEIESKLPGAKVTVRVSKACLKLGK